MHRLMFVLATLLAVTTAAAKPTVMHSPDGKIVVTLADDGKSMQVNLKGKDEMVPVIEIPAVGIGVDGSTAGDLKYKQTGKAKRIYADYIMPTGKQHHCSNQGNEYVVYYTMPSGLEQAMTVRVYNDGVAIKYDVDGMHCSRITDDFTTYRIPEGVNRWIQRFNASYEDFFPLVTTGADDKNANWGYPTLVEPAPGVFALISEAAIEKNQSASTLNNSADRDRYKVTLAPNTLTYDGSWSSPWRVMIIGDPAGVVESTLITDLSPESRIADTSWIHPGSVSWVYWAYNHGSNDYQIVKKYIDMAAEIGLPYILIDAEWDEMGNGGDIEDAVGYARERGVKPMVWYNSSTAWVNNGAPGPFYRLNKPEDREREFAWLDSIGVAGVKIDFFDGDTQATMSYCIDLLESAARHNLLVNFHGATIPRGWQRTYPNLMSVEGVYGAEWYNNKPVLTDRAAAHNATLPFTRNVIGPMDYTPCTFSDSQHPHITSHAHELALPVLYESALLHWADRPESYLAQPEQVRQLMATLPTVWDETRLIAGYPGESVAIARRSGNTWWIAGINGRDEAQTIKLNLKPLALSPGYTVTLFEDSGDNASPWQITEDTGAMPSEIAMQPRGGFVAIVKR